MFMILSLMCVLTILTQVKSQTNTEQYVISNVTFNFSRHIYVRKTIDNKIINITSSESNTKVKLFHENQNNKIQKQCASDSNDDKVFVCSFLDYGTYKFYYYDKNQKRQNLTEVVQIYPSLNDVFSIKKSRDTNCLFKKESFTYSLKKKRRCFC